MRRRLSASLIIAALMASPGLLGAAQRVSLRDLVREKGDINSELTSCGPPVGLREIVQFTQLTVEGTVAIAESSLTAAPEDSVHADYVITDYVIDVIRVFRLPTETATRSGPGPTDASPFVAGGPVTQPAAATPLRVRLRSPHHGRVVLDGGVITATSWFSPLKVGQHVIVSAYFEAILGAWVPFRAFEVREGRVVPLEGGSRQPGYDRLESYDSLEAFAAALANPPPTVIR